jgi:hypothetical protein
MNMSNTESPDDRYLKLVMPKLEAIAAERLESPYLAQVAAMIETATAVYGAEFVAQTLRKVHLG